MTLWVKPTQVMIKWVPRTGSTFQGDFSSHLCQQLIHLSLVPAPLCGHPSQYVLSSLSIHVPGLRAVPTNSILFFRRVLFTKVNSARIATCLKISMNLVYFHLQCSTSEWQLELNYTCSRNVLAYFQAVEKHLAGLSWVQTEP